jgi:hypothetical protein
MLASELIALKPESTQQAPSSLFGFGFVPPKLAGLGNLGATAREGAPAGMGLCRCRCHLDRPLTRPGTADESAVSGHPLPQGGRVLNAGLGSKCRNSRTKAPPFRFRE